MENIFNKAEKSSTDDDKINNDENTLCHPNEITDFAKRLL